MRLMRPLLPLVLAAVLLTHQTIFAIDLPEIQKNGVLRHLGVPYANFVAGDGTGLDVELMKLFAKEIGVRYEFVQTNWKNVIPDLTGKTIKVTNDQVEEIGEAPIRGDVIANGFTVLPWRKQVIDFSTPTFPTQVWLITENQSPLQPIIPSGTIAQDIKQTRKLLNGKTVLGMENTCLDLRLYKLEEEKAIGSNFEGNLNEMAPAVLEKRSDTTLLDVPDALVAMAKWPGRIKILGPISERQDMALGFRKNAPLLQKAFHDFFWKICANGVYQEMVLRYYPDVIDYYPEFFTSCATR